MLIFIHHKNSNKDFRKILTQPTKYYYTPSTKLVIFKFITSVISALSLLILQDLLISHYDIPWTEHENKV